MVGKLTPIQSAALHALRNLQPQPVLTGGAALGGYYLGHRVTRDLDLFFRGRVTLDEIPTLVESRLRDAGLTVRVAQSAPGFRRLDVRSEHEVVEVDLVAEPIAAICEPA